MGFPPRQMVLLSSGTGNEFDTSRTYGGWQLVNINDAELPEIQDREGVTLLSGDSSPRTLRYSDVYDFQGLESKLAIVVLPVTEDQVVLTNGVTLPREEHLNRTLYTGMSRGDVDVIRCRAPRVIKESLNGEENCIISISTLSHLKRRSSSPMFAEIVQVFPDFVRVFVA